MILPTMTLTELAKEIQSDYKEVHARWTKFNPKFNKMRLKQTYYPWIWNTEITKDILSHLWKNLIIYQIPTSRLKNGKNFLN